jgi:hypothetical protein
MGILNTTINVVYVAEVVSYDSSWILGIFTTRAGATSACKRFIDGQLEYYKTWNVIDFDTHTFVKENTEYYMLLRETDFFNNRAHRDGAIDSPIARVYELDRYIE